MPASFQRRPIEANEWQPQACEINFSEKLASWLGKIAAADIEMWTAWVTIDDDQYGEGYTEQCSQENTKVALSELDDDSDAVLYKDRRDGRYFRYTRYNHPEVFDYLVETVLPWSIAYHSIAPIEENFKAHLDDITGDLADEDLHVPDEW